ncbi:MAG TPA: SLC13 family permease [Xanthobacteraceae bacterium]|nr:SLC13 family permease [Xanthobacteraceae bacterium]
MDFDLPIPAPQAFAFAILAGMMAMFAWGRLRYDVVALLALLAGVFTGIVPYDKAFSGFSDDIVFIVASALVVSAGVARSGMIERVVRRISPHLDRTGLQVVVLAGTVTVLSAFVKNIGALAMMMPVAFQLARRHDKPVSALLMPMSFGALLGGVVTLIGTSPNIIVARVREELTGQPFGMFDFTPVGAGVAAVGLLFLAVGYRLLPRGRKGSASMDAAFNIEGYTTEVVVPEGSPLIEKTVADLRALGESEVDVLMLLRKRRRRYSPPDDAVLKPGDTMLLEGEQDVLDRVVGEAKLQLVRDDKERETDTPADDIGVMEAVVTGDSILVDRTPMQMRLYERYQVNLLAVSRRGQRVTRQMRSVRLQPGDVLVLQGNLNTMPETLGELRCLPLAARDLRLGTGRHSIVPVVILVAAMTAASLHVVPVAIAFFSAAVAMLLVRALTLREAYEAMEWPILVLLGALIPVSDALRTTGGTDLIAGWLSTAAAALPPLGALALIMVSAMAITPFLNNAATVLVMGPIAAGFATNLGYSVDAFLMAVAIGAACDFLTPIGHQCNTLVMGPGGYRFGDYWRLGLPLSIIVVAVGVPLIAVFWPYRP